MKVLTKSVNLGNKKFKVGINRHITVECFEKYPELLKAINEKQDILDIDEDIMNATDDNLLQILAEKKLLNKFYDTVEEINKYLPDLTKFALPLMLKLAEDNSSADEMIKYAEDNDVSDVFNNSLLGFIMLGFTQGELATPKVKFSME